MSIFSILILRLLNNSYLVAMTVSHLRHGIRQKTLRVGKYTIATGLLLSWVNCTGLKKDDMKRRALEEEEVEETRMKREQELRKKKLMLLRQLKKQRDEEMAQEQK